MKRPSFQWYPADWKNNAKLRRCSFALRGIWVEIIGLMHDSDEYGVLRWTLAEIANAVGCRLKDVLELHAKGVLKGAGPEERCAAYVFTPRHAGKAGKPVTLVPEQDGPIWFSSRMVVDEYKRNARSPKDGFGEPPKATPKPPIGDGGRGVSAPPDTPPDSSPSRAGARPGLSSSSSSTPSEDQELERRQELESSTGAPPRAVAIAVLLRKLEQKRGKQPCITSTNPLVQAWAAAPISDAQIEEAYGLAVAAREIKGDAAPINAAFLDVFIAKLLNPGAGASRLNGHAPALDWWKTSDGIFAKAETEGIDVATRETDSGPVRDSKETLARLCVKLGDGSWVDQRNATLLRRIDELRSEQGRA